MRPVPMATFILGPAQSVASVTDGTSLTAAASEQLLGIAGPYSQTTPTPVPAPWNRAMSRVAAGPLTDDACAASGDGWLLNKGAGWWDGNYQNALYNHYLTPNADSARLHRLSQPRLESRAELPPVGSQCALLRWPRRLRQRNSRSVRRPGEPCPPAPAAKSSRRTHSDGITVPAKPRRSKGCRSRRLIT